MAEVQVVTGAGPVGSTVALRLAESGKRVRILTRSGSGPEHPLIERLIVDVSDPAALEPALGGASAVFHCIHGSSYSAAVWEKELPRAEAVVLEAAGREDAVVVFPESLYSYDRPEEVMTESGPRNALTGKRGVRARLLQAREASATPTVSVVASDFFGPRALNSHMGERVVPSVLAGRSITVIGSLDVPHSFTYVPDLAAAMIAASSRKDAWNSVLHTPTLPALTQRGMIEAFAAAAGVPAPRLGAVPGWLVRLIGRFQPSMRELAEMLYQFERPFVMDSRFTEDLLGLAPTPLDDAARDTVAWWRARSAA